MSDTNFEEFDDFDIDDFGDEGSGGYNDTDKVKPKGRNPALVLGGGVVEGVKNSLLDPANQVKFLQQVLPEGYVHAMGVADRTMSGVREIYDEAAKEAKAVKKTVKKGVKTFLPTLNPILPKALSKKLEEFSKDDEWETDKKVNPEDSEIALTLGSIFSKYQEESRIRELENEAKVDIRETAGIKQQATSLKALIALNNTVSRLVSYQDQVTASYQHKSLELQYRHYFVSRKLLDVTQQSFELTKVSNEKLIHNTALPDLVKQHNSELAIQLLKTQTFGRATDSMSQWFRGIGSRIVKNGRANVQTFFRDIGSSLSDSLMMGEMAASGISSARDMGLSMAGGQAGSALAQYLASLAVKPARKFLHESDLMNGSSDMLMRLATDAPGIINEYAGSYTNRGGLLGKLEEFLKSSIGVSARSDTVMNSSLSDLDKNAVWNHQSQRTLNEVIPGWLSKMHIELKMIRTGDKEGRQGKAGRESFNFDTNRFETVGETISSIRDDVYNKGSLEWLNKEIETALNIIDPRVELPEDARIAIRKYMFKLANDRKHFNMGRLVNDEDFPAELMKWKNDILPVVSNSFKVDPSAERNDDGKWKNPAGPFKFDETRTQEKLREFANRFKRIQNGLPDIQGAAIRNAKGGNQEIMAEDGILKRDGSRWSVNNDQLLDRVLGSAAATPRPGPLVGPPAPPGHAKGGLHNNTGIYADSEGIFRAGGGLVEGEGTGDDDKVNANLSNREFVVNNRSVNLPGMLPLLRYINKLGLSGGSNGMDSSIAHEDGISDASVIENAVNRLYEMFKSNTDETNYILGDNNKLVKDGFEEMNYILADTNGLIAKISESFGKSGIPNIAAMFNGAMPDLGGIRQNARQHLSAFEQFLLAGKDVAKTAGGKLWGAATGTVSGIGATAGWAGRSAKNLGSVVFDIASDKIRENGIKAKEAAMDIYVIGMKKAKLTAYGIQNELYIDELTGRVVRSIEDITGPVKDKAGNYIITAEEFAKGVHRFDFKPVLTRVTQRMKAILDTAATPFKAMGRGVTSVKDFLLDVMDSPEDVYVSPDLENPRLTARGMEVGLYRLKETGAVITRMSQLTGVVVDAADKVLITVDELPKLVTKDGKPIRSIKGILKDLGKKALKSAFKAGKRVFDIAKDKVSSVMDTAVGWKDKAANFFKNPFTDIKDGVDISLVNRQRPVVERLDKIYAILEERLCGCKDTETSPIDKVDPRRAKRNATRNQKRNANKVSAVNPLLTGDAVNETEAAPAKEQTQGLTSLIAPATPATVATAGKPKVADADKSVTDGTVSKGSALDADGDGDVDNSAKDIKEKREKEAKEKDERSWKERLLAGFGKLGGGGKAAGGGFSIMGLLAMIPGVSKLAVGITKLVGGVVRAGSAIFGFLGKAKKFLGPLFSRLFGSTVARGAAGTAGRFAIGTGLRMAGTAALGAVAGVVGAPLATVAAVAAGGYLAYKTIGAVWNYFDSEDKPLAKFRLVQYGFKPSDTESAKKIAELEALCLKNIVTGSGSADLGNGVKLEEALKIFGVTVDQKQELEKWVNWFGYRFKRIFLAHVTTLNSLVKKTDITKADETLSKAQALVYLKRVHFGSTGHETPYLMMANPFVGEDELDMKQSDVNDAYVKALKYIQENSDDKTKDDAKSIDKQQTDKDKGKSWWESMRDGASDATPTVVKDIAKTAADAAGGAWGLVKASGNALAGIATGDRARVEKAFSDTGDIYSAGYNRVKNAVSNAVQAGGNVVSTLVKKGNASLNRAKMMAEMAAQGITKPVEQAMLMAQMHVESGGFTRMEENLNYRVESLMKMFAGAKRAGIDAVRNAVSQGPTAIAEIIYGGRKELGNLQQGDGYRYRGRGFTQLTGRANYAAAGRGLGIDLVNNPDLASDPSIAAKIALWYWKTRVGAAGATGDVLTVTKRINGGTHGLAERGALFTSYQKDIASGKVAMPGSPVVGAPASDAKVPIAAGPGIANAKVSTVATTATVAAPAVAKKAVETAAAKPPAAKVNTDIPSTAPAPSPIMTVSASTPPPAPKAEVRKEETALINLNKSNAAALAAAESKRVNETAKSSDSLNEVASIMREQLRVQTLTYQGIEIVNKTLVRMEQNMVQSMARPKAQMAAATPSNTSAGKPTTPKSEPVSMAKV